MAIRKRAIERIVQDRSSRRSPCSAPYAARRPDARRRSARHGCVPEPSPRIADSVVDRPEIRSYQPYSGLQCDFRPSRHPARGAIEAAENRRAEASGAAHRIRTGEPIRGGYAYCADRPGHDRAARRALCANAPLGCQRDVSAVDRRLRRGPPTQSERNGSADRLAGDSACTAAAVPEIRRR